MNDRSRILLPAISPHLLARVYVQPGIISLTSLLSRAVRIAIHENHRRPCCRLIYIHTRAAIQRTRLRKRRDK